MRADFVKEMERLLPGDSKAIFITGDLGFNAFEQLSQKLENRFLNLGVAEQNMMGFAAGVALAGFRPWVYSIATFATLRCLEQIRNDVCFHHLPVRIVGNGGGYTYGIMGSTHHALEDLAVLKALPNISLYFPSENDQVGQAVRQMQALQSPAYLRLGVSPYKTRKPFLSENKKTLTRHYTQGDRLTLIGVGHILPLIFEAFATDAVAFQDVDFFSVSRFPFDPKEDALLWESVVKTGKVIVVEEHYAPGGVGESLKAALPPNDSFQILSPYYDLDHRYGSSRFHLNQCGLTPEKILQFMGS